MQSIKSLIRRVIGHVRTLTDKTVSHNHHDITLFEKTNKVFYLIDVSVPNSGNLQTAYAEKMRKYADI
jgi:hypothetical protein